MKSLLIVSGLLAATLNVASAAPVTLDFEDLADGPVGGGKIAYGNTVIVDGFKLTTNASFGGLVTAVPGNIQYTGSKALFANTQGAETVLEQENGNAFSIASIGLTFTDGGINPLTTDDVTFFGTKLNSAIVQQTFTIGPGFTFGLETYNFSSAFTGLASLMWTHPSSTIQFDNVVVDGAAITVPAPAAAALFGFGLLGLMTRRRT